MLDLNKFFDGIRGGPLFPRGLNQLQVDCITEILTACEQWGVTDLRQQANILAQGYHETGPQRPVCLTPIREGFASSDAAAIAAVTNLYNRGVIRTNYALPKANGKSYFGRGFIQLTWPENYQKFGKLLNIDLYNHPEWALVKNIAADIMVVGMRDGLFRAGRKLSKYFNDKTTDWVGSRDIVNGDVAKNGPAIARYSKLFWDALNAATEAPEAVVATIADVPPPASQRTAPAAPTAAPDEDPNPPAPPPTVETANNAYVQQRLRELGYFGVGTPDGQLGDMTKDAIVTFRRRNGLPLSEEIDAAFLEKLEHDPVPKEHPARQEQSVATIAKKVPSVNKALIAEFWTKISAFGMGFMTFVGGLFSFLAPAKEWVDQNLAWITKIPTPVYLGLCFLALVFLYLKSRDTTKAGTDDFKSGRTN